MTEQELQELRKLADTWYEDDRISFQQSYLYDSLLNEVERLNQNNQEMYFEKQLLVDALQNWKEMKWAGDKEIERLRSALEEVFEYSKHDGISKHLDNCYVVARKALEGK